MRLSRILVGSCALLLSLATVALAQAPVVCVPTRMPDTSLTLSWTKPVVSPGLTLTGYRVDRQTDTGPWAPLRTMPVTALSTTDEGLLPGHRYNYAVFAVYTNAEAQIVTSLVGTHATDGTFPPCVEVLAPLPVPNVPTNVQLKAR